MQKLRVGIVGGSGYSGATMAGLLLSHPVFELAFCTSDSKSGELVRDLALPTSSSTIRFSPNAEAGTLARDVDAIVLATSATVSAEFVRAAGPSHAPIVDLSGAFRLASAQDYADWYALDHPAADRLADAHYGLPELFGPPPPDARLIANPGCYPTATLLALGPLWRDGLLQDAPLIVDGKSGVTGAGRQSKEAFSFGAHAENFRAYRLLRHQHQPEMKRHLGLLHKSGAPPALTFTAHLLPVRRGILATCYAQPAPGVTEAQLRESLQAAYGDSKFVRVMPPDAVELSVVVGTNTAAVGVAANASTVIVTTAIDNLLKGAAGQALQNLNARFGLDEATGLSGLQRGAF